MEGECNYNHYMRSKEKSIPLTTSKENNLAEGGANNLAKRGANNLAEGGALSPFGENSVTRCCNKDNFVAREVGEVLWCNG